MKPQNNNTPTPKLTLNKRTIVLLNEQNMEMINGGTNNNRTEDVSQDPNKCTGNPRRTKQYDGQTNCLS